MTGDGKLLRSPVSGIALRYPTLARLVTLQYNRGMRPRFRLLATLAGLAVLSGALSVPQDSFDSLARAALSPIDGALNVPGLRDSVEVIRDQWGVPHIYARNTDDLFFAQGFVQAQDRLWQMEMYRRTWEGGLAEVLGEEYVRHDALARLLRYRGPWDEREFQHYHPDGRRIFDAFAAGVNAYIAQAGDKLPVEFVLTGLRPQPWTAETSLLRTQTAMPIADARNELMLARNVLRLGVERANREARPSPYRDLVLPDSLDLTAIDSAALASLSVLRTGVVRPPLLPRYRALADAMPSDNLGVQENSPGSNNWALSGAMTASGKVIVANDPHRNVANPSIRYVVHLNAPGWNVVGATEAPLPGVAIGHNGRIAWGLTIVGTDQSDVYVERVNPANAREVRFRDAWEPMREVVDTIRVRDAAPVVVRHRFTRHGPVFHFDSARGLAYALRSTAHEPGSAGYLSALRYHALDDCVAFLDAQRYYSAPTENMVCGDTAGNIAWQASALSPKRPNWHGRLPVPGSGAYEWDGFRDDLPRELNPARGWIATANHDIHPEGFDPPLFFKNGPSRDRFERLESVFSERRGFTMRDMEALQHDAYSPSAARDIPLFRGWRADDPEIEFARALLANWDAQHTRESQAAVVYRFVSRAMTADARSESTPDMRRRALLTDAIRSGLVAAREAQGSDPAQWRWGRINRSELPHALVRAYDIAPVERHGGAGFVAAVGATFREIIDLGDLDASVVTNAPGQSGQPGSPFYANLVESYGRGEYFPLVYSRAAVDRAAAHRLVLRPR